MVCQRDMQSHSINKASLPKCPLKQVNNLKQYFYITIEIPWRSREINMKFQDKPGNSKACPAQVVSMTDSCRFRTEWRDLEEMLTPDQDTGPVQCPQVSQG